MRKTKITILNPTGYTGYEANLHRPVSKKNKRKLIEELFREMDPLRHICSSLGINSKAGSSNNSKRKYISKNPDAHDNLDC